MKLKSIRWRLPASYAAIAFLAALALGSVMLLVLNAYYTRQERDYLVGNARSLQPLVEAVLRAGLPRRALQDQVDGLAFLSQTRIRVRDAAGRALADSGEPGLIQTLTVTGAPAGMVMFSMPVNGPGEQVSGVFVRGDEGEVPVQQAVPFQQSIQVDGPHSAYAGGGPPVGAVDTILRVSASPYGYNFAAEAVRGPVRRSTVGLIVPLNDGLGTLEVTSGPAYGWEVMRSVALTWALAGLVAVLLAVPAGLYASRLVTRPVLALDGATRRMEGGDLSARVRLLERHPATEFAALADSFNGMAQRVEDTVATLRAFVADAAHELHTPLTALHTNLELAADEKSVQRRALFLERAQEQSLRLEALVGGLLDLSRIEAAPAPPEFHPLDLSELIRELGEAYTARAKKGRVHLEVRVPDRPVRARGDEAQLRRMLANLIENAFKFTPRGGTIRLGLEESGREAILSVADTGIGIPAEDQPGLFERFHRGRNASGYPGSGLGLAISRALVAAHGGTIRAESAAGEGTKMTVTLPLARE